MPEVFTKLQTHSQPS
jgi:hypothetical protein